MRAWIGCKPTHPPSEKVFKGEDVQGCRGSLDAWIEGSIVMQQGFESVWDGQISKDTLAQLLYLRKEIEELTERRQRMAERSSATTHVLSFTPRAKVQDRLGMFATELTYLDEMIEKALARCMHLYTLAFGYIDTIEDSMTRQIFRYRYLDGFTWDKVAQSIGEYDEQIPRKRHDAFLRRHA